MLKHLHFSLVFVFIISFSTHSYSQKKFEYISTHFSTTNEPPSKKTLKYEKNSKITIDFELNFIKIDMGDQIGSISLKIIDSQYSEEYKALAIRLNNEKHSYAILLMQNNKMTLWLKPKNEGSESLIYWYLNKI